MRIFLIMIGLGVFLVAGQALLGHFGPPAGGRFDEKVVRITREAPAPDTELAIAGGGVTSLAAWRGEVAVVTLWATWCSICVKEMPELQALAERYRGRGLSVLTVSVDEAPAEKLVLEFLKGRGFDLLPPLIDVDQALASRVGMRGTPTTVIVDRFGQIVAAFEGRAPWADEATHDYLEALIEAENARDSRLLLSSPASAGS